MKQKLAGYLLIIFTMFITFNACDDSDVNDPEKQVIEVTIGALVSLSGNWSTLGTTSKAALEKAVESINQNYVSEGSDIKINLKIIDTKLDPDLAYSGAQELITDGVKIIIGPQSSAELSAIKPLLDENDVFAVSMSSTAGLLALEDDHVLRFCPDDKPEGLAAAALMWERGIRKVVTVYRNDDGNIGLYKSLSASFSALGGEVIDSIKYANDDNITQSLIDQISTAVTSANGSGETAVYIAGFDELSDIFAMASNDAVLSSVIWVGSNGSAMSTEIVSNNTAAQFANLVEFCSPVFALSAESEDEWAPISESISQSTGMEPDAYTFAAYDAIMVAADAFKSVGSDINFSGLFSAYVETASDYHGLTGLTELNDAGDRKYGNFTMMGICGSGENFEWTSVGSYNAASGVLNYTGCN